MTTETGTLWKDTHGWMFTIENIGVDRIPHPIDYDVDDSDANYPNLVGSQSERFSFEAEATVEDELATITSVGQVEGEWDQPLP